jgi:hypothetical protein
MYAEAVDMFLKPEGGWHAGGSSVNCAMRLHREAGKVIKQGLAEIENRERSGQVSPERVAETYLRLGDKENAFIWLEKVFDARDISIVQFKVDPAYDLLRDDPRYAQLLSRIGQTP